MTETVKILSENPGIEDSYFCDWHFQRTITHLTFAINGVARVCVAGYWHSGEKLPHKPNAINNTGSLVKILSLKISASRMQPNTPIFQHDTSI